MSDAQKCESELGRKSGLESGGRIKPRDHIGNRTAAQRPPCFAMASVAAAAQNAASGKTREIAADHCRLPCASCCAMALDGGEDDASGVRFR
jgi:hypothetical protein